jgi:rhodanese-related sulfurtransferase
MPRELSEASLPTALENARAGAIANGLPYAGGVSPAEAWALVSSGQAVLVDVRTNEERVFVGYVPGSVHVPWATGTALTRNPRFARELEARLGGKDGAALAFNVLEGFEGDLDEQQQRGHVNGWRARGLPWVQD